MSPARLRRIVSTARLSLAAFCSLVLVTAALAQSPLDTALVFDPLIVIQPARDGTGSSFKDLVIGRSTRSGVAAALGNPTGGDGRVEEWRGSADCRRFDLEALTARFDEHGVLEQMLLRLRRPLLPGSVISTLHLTAPSEVWANGAQEIRLFEPAGIGMGITGGQVDALWLIQARPARADGASGAPDSPGVPRLLAVQRIAVEPQALWNNEPAMKVTATVRARRLESHPIRLEVRLRNRQGGTVAARPGSPPEFSDSAGLRIATSEQVRLADDTWSPSVFVPLSVLPVAPAGEPLIVSVQVWCAGYGALGEVESVLPPARAASHPAAVTVSDVRLVTTEPLDPHLFSSAGNPLTAEPGHPPVPGAIVAGTVQAEGLSQPVEVSLRLRQVTGEPVRASREAPPGEADAKGCFVRRATTPIVLESSYWPGLQGAIPYASLDLARGRHALILNYAVEADGLRAFAETDVELPIPATDRAEEGIAPPGG